MVLEILPKSFGGDLLAYGCPVLVVGEVGLAAGEDFLLSARGERKEVGRFLLTESGEDCFFVLQAGQ